MTQQEKIDKISDDFLRANLKEKQEMLCKLGFECKEGSFLLIYTLKGDFLFNTAMDGDDIHDLIKHNVSSDQLDKYFSAYKIYSVMVEVKRSGKLHEYERLVYAKSFTEAVEIINVMPCPGDTLVRIISVTDTTE